jgi:hypothetical protein
MSQKEYFIKSNNYIDYNYNYDRHNKHKLL